MEYLAERGLTESENVLLIFRSTINETSCFKFFQKRKNKDSYAFICLGCQNAKDAGHVISINSLRVTLDYRRFTTNPETIFVFLF
jgi:hypothetical protein